MEKGYLDRSFDDGLAEYSLDPIEQDEEVSDTSKSQSTDKPGRPAIPEKWTRVISFKNDDLENPKTHIIANDLLLVTGFQAEEADPN